MIKKTIPLLITFLMGLLGVLLMFLQIYPFPLIEEHLTRWIMIVTAFSIILGVVSLLKINVLKIQKGHRDGFFAAVLLAGFLTTSILGILGGVTPDESVYLNNAAGDSGDPAYPFLYRVKGAPQDAQVFTADDLVFRAGEHFKVGKSAEGATEFLFKTAPATADYAVATAAGGSSTVRLQNAKWNDRFKNKCYYFFTHLIKPMQSTMFALLAFFVASAAYRAFRVKNFEATVLLIAAFLVMLGRVPIGSAIWSGFPVISTWIMENINMPGSRAITFGTAIGVIAVSLKIILGIERGYMGGAD